jgi:hypothetical protein
VTSRCACRWRGRCRHSARTRPIVAEVAYPDVLVARAVTDGTNLDVVLRPGNGGGRTAIAVERLKPGRGVRDDRRRLPDPRCRRRRAVP